MSFISRYLEDIPPAIDWDALVLDADLTVTGAIAQWRPYFQRRSGQLRNGLAPISWAVVARGHTLVGLLPDWQLAGALWTEQGSQTLTLAEICLPVGQAFRLDGLGSFSAVMAAFTQTDGGILPFWEENSQRWGLLSIGNLVRQIDLCQVWQRLSLQTVAMPDCLLTAAATVADLAQQCFQHRLSAIPLVLPSPLNQESPTPSLHCVSLNTFLCQTGLDPQQRIAPDWLQPAATCDNNHYYCRARQLLKHQCHDYVLVGDGISLATLFRLLTLYPYKSTERV